MHIDPTVCNIDMITSIIVTSCIYGMNTNVCLIGSKSSNKYQWYLNEHNSCRNGLK